MSQGSIFGKQFCVSTFGESHGKAVGVVVDGCPAGLPLSEEIIQPYLDRRRPGQSAYTTGRQEGDAVEILSGVFEGKTTGTPIGLLIRNKDAKSKDYSNIRDIFRPGHADYGFFQKFGFRDYRGGGRSSGRETIGRVAAGAIAEEILKSLDIEVLAYAKAIGPVECTSFDEHEIFENPLYMPDEEAAEVAEGFLKKCMERRDSAGGIIECRIRGLLPGIGEPVFDKLDARLAYGMLSIGAVKGFELGAGFEAAQLQGSENNDSFLMRDGEVAKRSNHSGGVLGGMSDGGELVFRVAVKPTPSIGREQDTVDIYGNETEIEIKGRHDPVIVPRAVVVVETMAALVLVDGILSDLSSRMQYVHDYWKKKENQSVPQI